jgi:hypothetical protein
LGFEHRRDVSSDGISFYESERIKYRKYKNTQITTIHC